MRYKTLILITAFSVFAAGVQGVFTENVKTAKAVVYEDCDLDGYDDATGAAMPWIGFDATKGDEIPSDWDGKTIYGSKAEYKKAHEKSQSTDTKKSNTTSEKSKTSSSKKTTTTTKNNTKSQKTVSTKKTTDNSDKTKADKSSKKDKNKSDKSKKDSKKDSKKKNKKNTKKKDKKEKTKKKDAGKDETLTDNEDESTEESVEDEISEDSDEESDEESDEVTLDNIKLSVKESDGSLIHAGGNLLIRGEGVNEEGASFDIELHSDNNISLGNAVSDKEGAFQINADIPENIEPGKHEVVVYHDGTEITRDTIFIGQKSADSFAKSLVVGFDRGNKGLIPGALILAALSVLSLLGYIFGIVRSRRNK